MIYFLLLAATVIWLYAIDMFMTVWITLVCIASLVVIAQIFRKQKIYI